MCLRCPEARLLGVNEFYKKGCQEKTSASTGGREDFGLEIQPTAYCALDALEGFLCSVCSSSHGLIFWW
jgi:hypothetical protein